MEYTIREAAEKLGISHWAMRKRVKARGIKRYHWARRITIITEEDLLILGKHIPRGNPNLITKKHG